MTNSMTKISVTSCGEPPDEGFHTVDYITNIYGVCLPEKLNDKDGWVLDLNREHPRYSYIREMVLQSLNNYGFYYGVPHAIFHRVESPEFVKRWGRTLQKWGCAFPSWLYWTGIGDKLRNWATAILTIRDNPIEIRRGYVFYDLEILPYGPHSDAVMEADQTKARHDIYKDGLAQMRATFNVKQLEGSDLAPMPGQGTMLIYIASGTYKKLRRLHGFTTGS